jgi:hypothetical protein
MNKYEQLIEHIINDDETKARALFHAIVVERSREIYESLMDEDPAVSDNQVEDLSAEVTMDEEGMHEADDDMDMPGDDMAGGPGDDMGDLGGDMDMDDMGGDSDAPATKSDIMDLESAIDELKAEFDRLMNDVDTDSDGDHDMDDHDAEDDMDMDDEGDEEGDEEEGDEEEDEAGKNPFAESKHDKKDKKDAKKDMTEAERIREYVEKVGVDWDKGAYKGPKGENVGTGAKSERQGEKNTKSPVAGKNDMGGTTANILSGKGATEAAPDGQRPNGKAGGFMKSPQEIDVAKRNVNKPGGNKGAQNYYDSKASAKSGEQGGTNANSPLNGAPGRAK